jgi:hypothetical protein
VRTASSLLAGSLLPVCSLFARIDELPVAVLDSFDFGDER